MIGSLAAIALLAVSPLAALAGAAFLLINLPTATSAPVRQVLGLTMVLSAALLAGSRPLHAEDANDIEIYYELYRDLAAGDYSALTVFADGLEVGLPTLLLLWSWVLPKLSPNGLMFCLALTSAMIFLFWVEHGFYGRPPLPAPVLVGTCLLMLNLYYATQLSRQFLSAVVLLYAFTAHRPLAKATFVALASAFHLTAIPFYLLFLLVRRGRVGWFAMIALALILRVFFFDLLVSLDLVPAAIGEKLSYYAQDANMFDAESLVSLRTMLLLALASAVALLACRGRPGPALRPWIAAPWYTMIIQVLLLPIPLASLRGTLLIHSVLPGLLIYRMFASRSRTLLLLVLNLLLCYKVLAYATSENGEMLLPTALMLGKLFS